VGTAALRKHEDRIEIPHIVPRKERLLNLITRGGILIVSPAGGHERSNSYVDAPRASSD